MAQMLAKAWAQLRLSATARWTGSLLPLTTYDAVKQEVPGAYNRPAGCYGKPSLQTSRAQHLYAATDVQQQAWQTQQSQLTRQQLGQSRGLLPSCSNQPQEQPEVAVCWGQSSQLVQLPQQEQHQQRRHHGPQQKQHHQQQHWPKSPGSLPTTTNQQLHDIASSTMKRQWCLQAWQQRQQLPKPLSQLPQGLSVHSKMLQPVGIVLGHVQQQQHVCLQDHQMQQAQCHQLQQQLQLHLAPPFLVEDYTPAATTTYSLGRMPAKLKAAERELADCRACPRNCGVNRLNDELGVCNVGRKLCISTVAPHFAEEACLQGWNGSGTVFFSMCNLRCVFCQNWDISQKHAGFDLTGPELANWMIKLQDEGGCHNINFVTPEHVAPQAIAAAVEKGLYVPIIYNTSSYDGLSSLALMDGLVDVYMPDFKFWTGASARRYAKARDYPEVAKQAIKEMHRQVGDLVFTADGLAKRGLLLRHLVMPGLLDESKAIMAWVVKLPRETRESGGICTAMANEGNTPRHRIWFKLQIDQLEATLPTQSLLGHAGSHHASMVEVAQQTQMCAWTDVQMCPNTYPLCVLRSNYVPPQLCNAHLLRALQH